MNRRKACIKRHNRLRQNLKGSLAIPRLCVFRSLKNIEAQIIDDQNHHTLAFASTRQLKIVPGGNIKAAVQVGEAIAALASDLAIKQVVFDRGGNLFHGRVKALADAACKKGLKF